MTVAEKESYELSKSLFKKMFNKLSKFPHYKDLLELFKFDLKQFFLANQYSELLTKSPEISNPLENKLYLHHNMGIVMAGMIDLMSLQNLKKHELGQARSLFLLGQRAGRISNVLTTFEREKTEGDVTNEILSKQNESTYFSKVLILEQELINLYQLMDNYKAIQSFSSKQYSKGIRLLHQLHIKLKEII